MKPENLTIRFSSVRFLPYADFQPDFTPVKILLT